MSWQGRRTWSDSILFIFTPVEFKKATWPLRLAAFLFRVRAIALRRSRWRRRNCCWQTEMLKYWPRNHWSWNFLDHHKQTPVFVRDQHFPTLRCMTETYREFKLSRYKSQDINHPPLPVPCSPLFSTALIKHKVSFQGRSSASRF